MPRIPYEYPESCSDRSYYPTWEVDEFTYDHGAEQSSLSFNLTNLSNGNRIACAIAVNESLTRSSYHEARWVNCNSDDPPKEIPEMGVSGTKVLFDRDYSVLGIEQTWRCPDDEGSSGPAALP